MSLPRFSVNNPILVNLLMWTMVIGGVYSALTLVREMFPEVTPNQINISTTYPGASPADIEEGISEKIEEVVKDIDEVDQILTTVGEGYSKIRLILHSNVDDVDQVVADVKASIDTLPREDFPEEADETQVFKLEPKLPVIDVNVYGQLDDAVLKRIGKRLRDDLLAIEGISDVILRGTRRDEISIEIDPHLLIKYSLSFAEVANAIGEANLDIPGGQVKTGLTNVAVRTLGEKERADQIGQIILRSDPAGKVLRLNHVARVIDGFEDIDMVSRFNGMPAVSVTVFKTADQDAIQISTKIKALVAGKMGQPLQRDWLGKAKSAMGKGDYVDRIYQQALGTPYQVGAMVDTSSNLARFIEGRLSLLKRNGFWGLLFVFLSLLLFLNWRVALWVMLGLLLALSGTFIVMRMIGYTLNLISMFSLIVVLGLLVDDAIIVGEHIFSRVESGVPPIKAAIEGAEAVTAPVVTAITTTIVAFLPLLFIEGQIGDFMGVLPVIVMVALSVSLLEALSILPEHLAHGLKPISAVDPHDSQRGLRSFAARIRRTQAYIIKDVLMSKYERLLRTAVNYRYVTVAAMVSLLIVVIGLVAGGRVPLVFFPKMDSETLIANLKMPVGTPIAKTERAMGQITDSVLDLDELSNTFALIGTQYDFDRGELSGEATHLGQLIIELKALEDRTRTSEEILRDIRSDALSISGMSSLKFSAVEGGPGGAAIQIEVSGDRLVDLVVVADEVKDALEKYAGVYDIEDDFDAGRREVQVELLDSARALGLTTQSLATQVRAAFYGLEAKKLQRNREDVKIMVRYPRAFRRRVYDIESMRIATPSGHMVPFSEVARLQEGQDYAVIRRKDQKRTVVITADIDEAVANARNITTELERTQFVDLQRRYPGVQLEFGGHKREFAKAFGSIWRDFLIAALMIYAILAALFKSYAQPLVVMVAIPFGLIGAVGGHLLMGFPLTILSLIGLVALTGIVVNDSLILVMFINQHRREGMGTFESVVEGGRQRLRAILLTSITTILGLAPLLAERSFQARFLIPMGLSIAAGLAFATVLTLVAVPSLYMIFSDLQLLITGHRAIVGQAEEYHETR